MGSLSYSIGESKSKDDALLLDDINQVVIIGTHPISYREWFEEGLSAKWNAELDQYYHPERRQM